MLHKIFYRELPLFVWNLNEYSQMGSRLPAMVFCRMQNFPQGFSKKCVMNKEELYMY